MVKAFMVHFKESNNISLYQSNIFVSGTSCSQSCSQIHPPIMVISNSITDVAIKYPTAYQIMEWEGSVDILTECICPVEKKK
jgi:hypothetical protein